MVGAPRPTIGGVGMLRAIADFARRAARVLALWERRLELQLQSGAPPAAELFVRHAAFRWRKGALQPLHNFRPFNLDELFGVENVIAQLVHNTEQFLAGGPAHNVLLFGARGTGKSSAVRGLLTSYAARGLRVVEMRKEDLLDFSDLLDALRGAEGRFLIYCDDLSFDANERDFRELKSALEGGLAAPPDNVRLIATSNRRHLLPETHLENRDLSTYGNGASDGDAEIRRGEALDEKLALAERFGLALGFFAFDQNTYLQIVRAALCRAGVPAAESGGAEVRAAALRWALRRSSRSGRTAQQFVTHYLSHRASGGA